MINVYNPLDEINLGKSVAGTLIEQIVYALGDILALKGGGIYFINYYGLYPAESPIAASNATEAKWPIYIGKAFHQAGVKDKSDGQRARRTSLQTAVRTPRVQRRCRNGSATLAVEHFRARYLIVDDIFIPDEIGSFASLPRAEPEEEPAMRIGQYLAAHQP